MKKHLKSKRMREAVKFHKAQTAHTVKARPQLKRHGITSIKVVGIGGGGGNVITRMMGGDRMRGVEFIAVNTDAQDLDYAIAHRKVYIGKALTRGLGAGMNPDIGKQAAEENRSEIGEILEGSDIVFITAGMGGGTGSGASPVIADIARERGILTVAVVTKPFSFEGTQRMNIAQEAIHRLKDKVDALVVIPNDRIFTLIDKDTTIVRAFSYIDDILKNGVQAIAELVNTPGIINVDFADIKTVMKDAGQALIGIGVASGQDRSAKAVAAAITSPLLETSIDGAKGVLFSIAGGRDLKMAEVNEIAKAVAANIDTSARVIFGAYYDHRLKEKSVKVTVIATGFNGLFGQRIIIPTLFRKEEPKFNLAYEESKTTGDKLEDIVDEEVKDEKIKKEREVPKQPEWEIPAFLRKKKR